VLVDLTIPSSHLTICHIQTTSFWSLDSQLIRFEYGAACSRPVVEEFGGKLEHRLELYTAAFDHFYESALRGGSGGGAL
jgi:hypothetical protein